MNHIKTFYIGCEDNGERATLENNVLRINKRFNMAHKLLLGALCPHFFNAQVLAEENPSKPPYKLAIYCLKDYIEKKINQKNANTIKDTFWFYMQNMHPPKNGMIISFYSTETMNKVIHPLEDFKHYWPLKKEWQWIGDGDYITFQDVEEGSSSYISHQFLSHRNRQITKDIDEHSVYPVKRISYKTADDEMFELLKHAKFHVSYPGGTYYSGQMIGVPTIGVYLDKKVKHNRYINQDEEEIWANVQFTMSERVNTQMQWGYFMYDHKLEKAVISHQKTVRHVTNDELLCYLKGYDEP